LQIGHDVPIQRVRNVLLTYDRRYWQKVRSKVKPPKVDNPRKSRRFRHIDRKESRLNPSFKVPKRRVFLIRRGLPRFLLHTIYHNGIIARGSVYPLNELRGITMALSYEAQVKEYSNTSYLP
jgi:hypothetical protein